MLFIRRSPTCATAFYSRSEVICSVLQSVLTPRNRRVEAGSSFALRLRQLNRTGVPNYEAFKKVIEHSDTAICANAIVSVIKAACYLLDRQIERLEEDFFKRS